MNFKRFHESKNLLPSDSVRYEYAIRYGNEVITFSGGAMYIVPIENGETYTVKIHTPNVSVSVIRLALYEQLAPSPDTTAYNTREILNTIEPTLTITNSKNKPYLIVQIAGAYVDAYGIDDVMLNTGSQPLPYEPYSSEVWHDIPHYIHNTSTDTITTLPADIYANDTTATVGLKGNMYQASGVSPTTPIQPQETGERTGNLFDEEYPNIDGTVRYKALNLGNGTYTLSSTVEVSQGSAGTLFFLAGNVSSGASTATNAVYKDRPITVTSTDGYVTIAYRTYTTDTPVGKETMLNTGSTPLPYEPYGYKIPISSASTTTPIYLGEVPTTRRIKKLVLTGQEKWNRDGTSSDITRYRIGLTDAYKLSDTYNTQFYISHYKIVAGGYTDNTCFLYNSNIALLYVCVDINTYPLPDDFKAFLAAQYAAGTPVTVWYVLATEETGIVNEPLRKIGECADTVSGITIPTIAGANSFDVLTTLKPSEVTVNYKGWHDASVKEWDGSQWD